VYSSDTPPLYIFSYLRSSLFRGLTPKYDAPNYLVIDLCGIFEQWMDLLPIIRRLSTFISTFRHKNPSQCSTSTRDTSGEKRQLSMLVVYSNLFALCKNFIASITNGMCKSCLDQVSTEELHLAEGTLPSAL
jgi:hypothetical protein